jgi:hypothetical protein
MEILVKNKANKNILRQRKWGFATNITGKLS